MTIPNAISIGRLVVLAPLFAVVLLVWQSPGWALGVLVLLGVTDWADGFIARRFDQVSELGKKLDPIADRLSQVVVCLTLVAAGLIPLWMLIVLAAADLMLGITVLATKPGIVLVRWIGRIRTVLLMVGFPLVLFVAWLWPASAPLATAALVVVGAGVLLHAVANLDYTVRLIVAPETVTARPAPETTSAPTA